MFFFTFSNKIFHLTTQKSSNILTRMNKKDIILLYNSILQSIQGDWLLIGGALLHVMNIHDRETLDIDLVPLGEVTNKDQLALMDIAVKNNFAPETINFSAEYFVKRVPNWKKELVLLTESKHARLYRPTKKLFRQLKEQRGTETDLNDIALYDEHVEG